MEPLCPPENQEYGAPVIQVQPPYQGPPGQPQPMYQGPPPGQPPYQGPPPGQPTPVVINQTTPLVVNTVVFSPDMFKLSPVNITCPFCRQMVTTRVQTSCSCCACCFCLFTTFLCYCIVQCIRGKNLICQNAVHSCPNCKQVIGRYEAC